jgi:hypothetical protein
MYLTNHRESKIKKDVGQRTCPHVPSWLQKDEKPADNYYGYLPEKYINILFYLGSPSTIGVELI